MASVSTGNERDIASIDDIAGNDDADNDDIASIDDIAGNDDLARTHVVASNDSMVQRVPNGAPTLVHVSDDELLANTRRLVGKSNQLLAALLLHLAEVEARGAHRSRRCASLYTYCVYELRFSEDAAARRSAAARFAREFPPLLDAVAAGEIHLTGLLMIGRVTLGELHLEAMKLLVAALEKRKVGINEQPRQRVKSTKGHEAPRQRVESSESHEAPTEAPRQRVESPESHEAPPLAQRQRGRYVPAAVRREVYQRDGARCTYLDARGLRCCETRYLELHHLQPFAKNGAHLASNLTLRCSAHNALAAEDDFGPNFVAARRGSTRHEAFARTGIEQQTAGLRPATDPQRSFGVGRA